MEESKIKELELPKVHSRTIITSESCYNSSEILFRRWKIRRKRLLTVSLALDLTVCRGKVSESSSNPNSIEYHNSINYDVSVVVGMPVFIDTNEK